MQKWIDLRSDTVTNPTVEMRQAMVNAIVGDDVYNDDPTVKELEELAASIVCKEAALFVPSGTFANQLALFTHCDRGDEVILGEDCHIVAHEVGAAAVISNVNLRTLETINGKMDLDRIQASIRYGEDIHWPKTKLICLENAYSNGVVLSPEYMSAVHKIAKDNNLLVHLDGARLFNAATSLDVEVDELTQHCDTLMFCLSKGLCAPIGSLLVGSKEFIEKARKNRKLLGGGMRQVGVLAAAGIVALNKMRHCLQDDHKHAALLAAQLGMIPGITVKKDWQDINMVFCTIDSDVAADSLVDSLYKKGIKVNGPENGVWRFVTHFWVTEDDMLDFASVLKKLLGFQDGAADNEQESDNSLVESASNGLIDSVLNQSDLGDSIVNITSSEQPRNETSAIPSTEFPESALNSVDATKSALNSVDAIESALNSVSATESDSNSVNATESGAEKNQKPRVRRFKVTRN